MYINTFKYTPKDVSCQLCTEYVKKLGCTALRCPWLAERIEAGVVGYREAVLETFPHERRLFQRLNLLIKHYPGSLWSNEQHERRMQYQCAVQGYRRRRDTNAYYAAMYLLTSITAHTGNLALVNTWFTYTTDKDGVYTLTSVASAIDTAKKVKVAQSNDTTSTVIDKKNISLDGGTGYTKVYGNNATVYLTAELKQIAADNGTHTPTVIISGVDNVTTGVKNASIDLWKDLSAVKTGSHDYSTATAGAAGAYVLYKDNGYVIAAVVVGEDGEAAKNLVYVNSDKLASESYDKAADEWTWTREAIYNGEKITLTEVGDSLQYIGTKAGQGNMQEHTWYQVKFNAQGQVIKAELASKPGVLKANEYVDDIANLKTAIAAVDNVLYTQTFGTDADTANAAAPSMKGNTLYTNNDLTKGFYVDEDAKVVFIQKNDGKKTTDYATGADEVQNFIDKLNDKNGSTANGFCYTISAQLENGVAKTVIIVDKIDATYKPGEATKPSAVAGLPATEFDSTTSTQINVALANGEATTAYDKAVAFLKSKGYTVEKVTVNGTEYDITASKGIVTGYTFTTNTTVYYKVAAVTWTSAVSKATTTGAGYYTNGDDITVVLTRTSGAFAASSYTATATGISGSSTTATVSGDKKTVTVKVSGITGLTDDVDSWSIALS